MKKILLLGSGELGKEFVIAAQRLGQTVVACDKYADAPAMQVADGFEVFDMLDGEALAAAVAKHRPDVIVPEIEAIRTERPLRLRMRGHPGGPECACRELHDEPQGDPRPGSQGAGAEDRPLFLRYVAGGAARGGRPDRLPVRGKTADVLLGQGPVGREGSRRGDSEIARGCEGSRGDIRELIVEEFIRFDSEITLLTVTQKNGPTLFCPPIGHVQKGGDYRESFQTPPIAPEHLAEAQRMAAAVTEALTGAGLWGVEFFLSHEHGVYFSELSPRPHDTGMVTLAGTQNLSEFELHLRAVLGLPIPEITFERMGASAVILSPVATQTPHYEGIGAALADNPRTDIRIFGKPTARVNRRMGVVVGYEPLGSDLDALRTRVKAAAAKVKITE